MKWLVLPIIALILILGGVLWGGRGVETFDEPLVSVTALYLLGVCCLPLLRRVVRIPWLCDAPWCVLILVWNGTGAILALDAILALILATQYSVEFSIPPGWCMAVFFWLWFLPAPFATLTTAVFLWKNHETPLSKIFFLCCLAIMGIWGVLLATIIVIQLTPGEVTWW